MGQPDLPPPPLLDAGWYADPTGRYEARYWDARRWTSHISHYGATGVDPILRARMQERMGIGLLWAFRLVFTTVLLGVAAYAAWRLWPEGEKRNLVADRELAQVADLASEDVPDAWSIGPNDRFGPLSLELDSEPCADLSETAGALADEPRSESTWLAPTGLSRASSTAVVTADAETAGKYVNSVAESNIAACLEAELLTSVETFGTDASVVDAVLRQMSPPSVGDEAVWWRLEGRLEGDRLPLDIHLDLVTYRVDRVIVEITFIGLLEPLDPSLQRQGLATASSRLDTAVNPPETPTAEAGSDDADGVDDGSDDTPGDDQPGFTLDLSTAVPAAEPPG